MMKKKKKKDHLRTAFYHAPAVLYKHYTARLRFFLLHSFFFFWHAFLQFGSRRTMLSAIVIGRLRGRVCCICFGTTRDKESFGRFVRRTLLATAAGFEMLVAS